MTMVRDEHGIRFEANDKDWQPVRQARLVAAVANAHKLKAEFEDVKQRYERALIDVRRRRKQLTGCNGSST